VTWLLTLESFTPYAAGAFHVSTQSFATTFFLFLVLGFAGPVYAQEPAANPVLAQWSIITAGFALGIAAGLAAIGQGMSVGRATEALARNPSAAGEIRGALILGLVLIESLVIYVLLISLILFFIQPFGS
jgi:F-type H+-transporting ATPase subunit c